MATKDFPMRMKPQLCLPSAPTLPILEPPSLRVLGYWHKESTPQNCPSACGPPKSCLGSLPSQAGDIVITPA